MSEISEKDAKEVKNTENDETQEKNNYGEEEDEANIELVHRANLVSPPQMHNNDDERDLSKDGNIKDSIRNQKNKNDDDKDANLKIDRTESLNDVNNVETDVPRDQAIKENKSIVLKDEDDKEKVKGDGDSIKEQDGTSSGENKPDVSKKLSTDKLDSAEISSTTQNGEAQNIENSEGITLTGLIEEKQNKSKESDNQKETEHTKQSEDNSNASDRKSSDEYSKSTNESRDDSRETDLNQTRDDSCVSENANKDETEQDSDTNKNNIDSDNERNTKNVSIPKKSEDEEEEKNSSIQKTEDKQESNEVASQHLSPTLSHESPSVYGGKETDNETNTERSGTAATSEQPADHISTEAVREGPKKDYDDKKLEESPTSPVVDQQDVDESNIENRYEVKDGTENNSETHVKRDPDNAHNTELDSEDQEMLTGDDVNNDAHKTEADDNLSKEKELGQVKEKRITNDNPGDNNLIKTHGDGDSDDDRDDDRMSTASDYADEQVVSKVPLALEDDKKLKRKSPDSPDLAKQQKSGDVNDKQSTSKQKEPNQKHETFKNDGPLLPRRQAAQSAQNFRRPVPVRPSRGLSTPRSTSSKSSPLTARRPKTSETSRSFGASRGVQKNNHAQRDQAAMRRDFFHKELDRLQQKLSQEKGKIKRPQEKKHCPFVWTSLEPYCNTDVPNYLINLPDEELQPQRPKSRGRQGEPVRGDHDENFYQGYSTRNTAIGLCDPWVDLRMDRGFERRPLPRIQNKDQKPERSSTAGNKKDKEKEKPLKEGSTRLPKFPVVDFNAGRENATKMFPYYEVKRFRGEMQKKYSLQADKRVEQDYKRTKQDFYRMELNRLDAVHPINRPHMRKAYFAYLQNTPGSKKAVVECMKTLQKPEDAENEPQENSEQQEQQQQQQQQAVEAN